MKKLSSKFFAWPLICAGLVVFSSPAEAQNARWATAICDTLLLELVVSGEISAMNSTVVTTPIIWDFDLQIIDMMPEGEPVDSGAVLVKLDPTILVNNLGQQHTRLQSLQAELEGLRAENEGKIDELKRQSDMKAYSLQLAQVDLELLQYASSTRKKQGELEILKAEAILHEAKAKLKAELVTQKSAETEQQRKIFKAQGEVDHLQRQLEQMTLRAPIDGLVVYHAAWNGDKPQIGEKVRLGKGVIDLPDLSRTQVKVKVNAIDAAKLAFGQKAALRLEAFPEKIFHAKLAAISKIPIPLEKESQVRVFETILAIAETDSVLKPGMTAKVNILLDEIPDAVLLPIGSVYEIAGQPVVFTEKSGNKPIQVKVGARNFYYISVEGIPAGTKVAWQPAAREAKPLGYAEFQRRRHRPLEEYDAIFTEMKKRHLSFDYENAK